MLNVILVLFLIFLFLFLSFITSAKRRLRDQVDLSVIHSLCHSVCVYDCCKSNQPISLKIDAVIRPTSRKN